MRNLIVYGDIHGCYNSFKLLRKIINPNKDDIEVCVGDIITKGNDSIKVLNYIIENNIKSVLGNHEDKLVRYLKHAKNKNKNPINIDEDEQEIINKLNDKHIEYLENLPLYLKYENITILHGGLLNHFKLNKLTKKEIQQMIRLRYIDEKGNFISQKDKNEKSMFWTDRYDGNEGFIVHGHQNFTSVNVEKHSIGIDTGCVYGNKLSAVIFSKANANEYKIKSIDANESSYRECYV